MSDAAEDRLELQEVFTQTIGRRMTGVLMSYLNDEPNRELATSAQLVTVESSLRSDMDRLESSLRSDMDRLESSLRSDMDRLESSVRSEITTMGVALRGEMAQLGGDVRSEMAELKVSLQRFFVMATLGLIAAMAAVAMLVVAIT